MKYDNNNIFTNDENYNILDTFYQGSLEKRDLLIKIETLTKENLILKEENSLHIGRTYDILIELMNNKCQHDSQTFEISEYKNL